MELAGAAMTMRIRVLWLAITAVLTGVGCTWAPPVNYPIPPGISASFPPSHMQMSEVYGKTFCSVLAEDVIALQGWGPCDQYVSMSKPHPAESLPSIHKDWTLLLIGGFGAECVAKTITAFSDSAEHLDTVHGVKSKRVPVTAFGSSEENAARILEFVENEPTDSTFIVVAHSKGAADAMVALANYASQLRQIKALVTVAGAVGGSWLADDFAEFNDKVIKAQAPGQQLCPPGAARGATNGIDSMRRQVRQEFLASVEPTIPAYSISAVATEEQMSKALKPLWRRLRPYAREQDSHIIEREAVVPGGLFLGRALGDHWAVAMPVYGNPKVRPEALRLVDRNHFPRVALIEAAVRIVTDRLYATDSGRLSR